MPIRYTLLLPLLVLGLAVVGCDDDSVGADELGDNTTVGFVETSASVDEAQGSVSADVVANDPGFKRFSVTLTVDQTQSTATLGEDVRGLPADTTLAFKESTTDGQTLPFSFDVVDEPIDSTGFLETPETLVLSLSATDTSGTAIGDGSTFTVTINEDDDPLSTQEARDRPLGKRAVVDGTVTRVEADGAFVQDGEGALFVFDGSFPDQVSRGDSVRVDGTTSFFSGLFQLGNVTSGELTQVLSSGTPLPPPALVTLGDITEDGEAFESELIRVEDFAIDDGGDDTFQGSTNYSISNNSGSSTLRISGDSELVGEDIPDRANFEGVLSQFNGGFGGADEPDEGYQLLGLKMEDLEEVAVSATFSDNTLSPMSSFSVASENDWQASDPPVDTAPVAEASGFGGDEPANDWLISPAINFNNFQNETLRFLNAKGFNDAQRRGLQVKVSTDYDGITNPENFEWTNISNRVTFAQESDKDGGNFTPFIDSGMIDLSDSEFQGNEVYIAFQYRSSGTGGGESATWQVDNIVISGQPSN